MGGLVGAAWVPEEDRGVDFGVSAAGVDPGVIGVIAVGVAAVGVPGFPELAPVARPECMVGMDGA